jgi:predicted ester cyclase
MIHISPQYITQDSQFDPAKAQLRGSEAFIDQVKGLRAGFPDLRQEVQRIITQDNMVVYIIKATGTHTGNFFTLPPTGNKASWESVHIYRIGEDGKIVEHKANTLFRTRILFFWYI